MSNIFDLFDRISSSNSPLGGKPTHLIVGLGNPGLQYENTRHNAGFMTLDTIAQRFKSDFHILKFRGNCGEANVGNVRCLLLKPGTYMNLSGVSVAAAANFYKIPPENILVIYDDITQKPGQMRIRKKGSAGGHNGIKSIIEELGTDEFPRIRIGVGDKPNKNYDLADWVLSKFTENEMETLQKVREQAAEAAELIVNDMMEAAMNRFSH